MSIKLKPTREWCEKSKDYPKNSIRIYIGNLWIGWCELISLNDEKYNFRSNFPDIIHSTNGGEGKTLDEWKEDCELSLKEFAAKFIQTK